MAFFQLVLKAKKVEKARLSYENEKFTSIEISKGAKPKYTLKQRFRRGKFWLKRKVKKLWDKILSGPRKTWFYKKIAAMRTEGTVENFVAKSFCGFVGGILLTYIFFVFFVIQLHFKLSSATTICTFLGVILTMGLAFSYRVRCVVFLLLPQFFSKRGRQALMAYAFILALTGPVKNTMLNTAILTESLTCAQEQLKEVVKAIVDLAKQPFHALKEAISKVIKSVKGVVKRIKQTLIAIKRLVLSILRVITSVFQWLGSIINICNKKLGTPFDRCQRVFDGAVADCKAKLGPYFGVVCNITYVVSALCYIVKPLDFICMLVSYVADVIVDAVRAKIKKFTMHMKAMFYVKVKFSHSFHFDTNQSKSIQEVSTSISTEVRSRTNAIFGFLDWMSCATSLLGFVILLRVLRYRYKWLTSERFDNRYITDDLRTIDLIRASQDKETVLPLNRREKNKYVPLSSVFLIRPERLKLGKSIVFLSLATVKLASYIMIDYSLYWVLNIIQTYGRFESKVDRPNVVGIHVSGEGYLSDLYRSIVKAFTPHGNDAQIDTMICLPTPVPPNLDKYTQIIILIVFCWLMAFLEPYGLRLRQVVMCQYYPDRAKQRAAWLYNHIIRSRGNFLKFARRQLRRKFGLAKGENIEKVTLRERLWATIPCLNLLCPLKQKACLMCGAVEREDEPHIKCPTPGCVGLFCQQCFAELQNICTICRSPIEYGDLTDMSEELDSSVDEFPLIRPIESEVMGEYEGEEEEWREKIEEEVEEEWGEEIEEVEEEQPEPEEVEEEQPEPEEVEEEQVEEEVGEEETLEPEEVEEETQEPEEEAEEKVEEEEKLKKEVSLQADVKPEESDRTSESSYSYSYQDESPREAPVERRREPFKDLEAQKIRDDVTIQIFNEPFVRDPCSGYESPPCFVVRARRKVCARSKRKPKKRTKSPPSIADTESWSTEEIDEEEVIHIEVDDSSEELLPKDRRDQENRGRINRIVSAVARIPWLGKGEDDKKCLGLRRKRPSLMNRIVSMLQRKQSMPIQSYRRRRKTKDSSSSSSHSCDDENDTLLCCRDDRQFARRRNKRRRAADECDEVQNSNLRYPCEQRFATRQMPRYLESSARSTSYFEIDETEDSRTAHRCARQVEDINKPSSNTCLDATYRDRWNIPADDDYLGTCSCASEITYQTTGDREMFEPCCVSEHTDNVESSTREAKTEDTMVVSPIEINHTDETRSVEVVMKSDDTGDAAKLPEQSPNDLIEKPPEKVKTQIKKEGVKGKRTNRKVPASPKGKSKRLKPEGEIAQLPVSRDPLAGHQSKKKGAPLRQKVDVEQKVEETKGDVGTMEETQQEGDTSGKESENNDTAKEVKQTEEAKIDKSTDLPDKNRSTQTKLHSRDKDTKGKQSEGVSEASDTRRSRNISKEFNKKQHRKSSKEEDSKPGTSKRPALINEEKIDTVQFQDKDLPPEPKQEYPKEEKPEEDQSEKSKRLSSGSDKWDSHENIYSLYDSHTQDARHTFRSFSIGDSPYPSCSRNYEVPHQVSREINIQSEASNERFEMPVIKKYLPMYQSPELIEELKRHDRMKLIREREARRRRIEKSPDSISTSSRMDAPRTDRSIVCDYLTIQKLPKDEDTFPYQESQAYRNVLSEFQRRTRRQRDRESSDSIPLLHLSKKADKSKKVELLYPPRDRSRRRSDAVKRFAKRMIAPFKLVPCEKYERKARTHLTSKKKDKECAECSCNPEIFSDISSVCISCRHKSDATSANETTDSNESSR